MSAESVDDVLADSFHYWRECPNCGFAAANYLHCCHDRNQSKCSACDSALPFYEGECNCELFVPRSRLEAALAREREAVALLRAEVREWLCVSCATVYPGPPQPGVKCVICPKCKGQCGPRGFMERRADIVAVLKVADEILTIHFSGQATPLLDWAQALRRAVGE